MADFPAENHNGEQVYLKAAIMNQSDHSPVSTYSPPTQPLAHLPIKILELNKLQFCVIHEQINSICFTFQFSVD